MDVLWTGQIHTNPDKSLVHRRRRGFVKKWTSFAQSCKIKSSATTLKIFVFIQFIYNPHLHDLSGVIKRTPASHRFNISRSVCLFFTYHSFACSPELPPCRIVFFSSTCPLLCYSTQNLPDHVTVEIYVLKCYNYTIGIVVIQSICSDRENEKKETAREGGREREREITVST